MYFVVTQDFIKTDITQEMMTPHINYMYNLINKGIAVISGPFADNRRGGMFVLEVENEEELKLFIENDPAVVSGILKNDIRPYNLSYVRNSGN